MNLACWSLRVVGDWSELVPEIGPRPHDIAITGQVRSTEEVLAACTVAAG
jgi:hypothetical protein